MEPGALTLFGSQCQIGPLLCLETGFLCQSYAPGTLLYLIIVNKTIWHSENALGMPTEVKTVLVLAGFSVDWNTGRLSKRT